MTLSTFPSVHVLCAGTATARVSSTRTPPPADPVEPSPTECRNLRALITALTKRHGSQRALADHLGIAAGTVARMKLAAPRDDRAFAIARGFVETVAKSVDPSATVEDVLAGRLLARAEGGAEG